MRERRRSSPVRVAVRDGRVQVLVLEALLTGVSILGQVKQPLHAGFQRPQQVALLGLHKSPATIALVIALVAVVAVGVLLKRSATGLKLQSVGLSPTASRRLGIPVQAYRFGSLTVAGAFSGVAGGLIVATAPFVLAEGFSSGFGFTGLVVGLLARGSMTAVACVSLLLGFLVSGGINLQLAVGVPASTVSVVESVLIILIAGASIWTTTTVRSRTKEAVLA